MFCIECGQQIDNSCKFCPFCGTKQVLVQVPKSKTESKIEPSHVVQNISPSNKAIIRPDKFDRSYKGDRDITNWGLIFVILNITLYLIGRYQVGNTLAGFIIIGTLFGFISWIIAVRWVVRVAEHQNRNSTMWGIFAVFISYLAMIIIGQLGKINHPSNAPNYRTNWAIISAVFIIPIITLALIFILTN